MNPRPTHGAWRSALFGRRERSADAAASLPADVLPENVASHGASRRSSSAELVGGVRAGYERSTPREQTTFVMTSTFAVTIVTSRLINYVREQRRALPQLRHAGRVLTQLPGDNSIRVHHYLPGIGISFAAGGIAIFQATGPWQRWLSVLFAAGLALTSFDC